MDSIKTDIIIKSNKLNPQLVFTSQTLIFSEKAYDYSGMSNLEVSDSGIFRFLYNGKKVSTTFNKKQDYTIIKELADYITSRNSNTPSEPTTQEGAQSGTGNSSSQTDGPELHVENNPPMAPKKKGRKGCLIFIIIAIIFIIAVSTLGGEDDTPKETTETKATEAANATEPTTAKPATEPTKAKFKKSDYKNIAYNDLARNPDKYEYESVTNSGKVIQVMESDDEIQLRVAIDDNYDKVVLLGYNPSLMKSRVLEDDNITYYGMSMGVLTYESTMGGNITVPGVYATKIVIK